MDVFGFGWVYQGYIRIDVKLFIMLSVGREAENENDGEKRKRREEEAKGKAWILNK